MIVHWPAPGRGSHVWPQPVKGECAESCADLCGSRDPDAGFVRQSDGSHMPHSREQLWGSTLHETVHQNRTGRQNVAVERARATAPCSLPSWFQHVVVERRFCPTALLL